MAVGSLWALIIHGQFGRQLLRFVEFSPAKEHPGAAEQSVDISIHIHIHIYIYIYSYLSFSSDF